MHTAFVRRVEADLRTLCLEIGSRPVGSAANRAATAYCADRLSGLGLAAECPAFGCMDWSAEGVRLEVGGVALPAAASPYSLGVSARAPLVVVSTLDELERATLAGRIVLLRGQIAHEQLMPKRFPFYNPEEHQRIVCGLEERGPRAIITAAERDPSTAGARYPFPLIEDGDFDIPSVYMSAEEGLRLARYEGQEVILEVRATRRPASGSNVAVRIGSAGGRWVALLAHVDTKPGTPGALDDAAGVAALLLLAEMLRDYSGSLGIELTILNGEDYYAVPGERLFLERHAERFDDLVLGINLDGLGYREGRTAYSTYGCPPELAQAIERAFGACPGLLPGKPWYQGDHCLFLPYGRPALALTSECAAELSARVIHTAHDRPGLVDTGRLAAAAQALCALLHLLAQQSEP